MTSKNVQKVNTCKIGKKRGVVGVIKREDRFLIIRRSKFVTAPRKLCLPGGTMEKGETEIDTLVREMKEELSIDVTPVRLCWRSCQST
jgi:8-oxo-dGTP pyrophosphatase MutT (NUDIX family)